MAGPVTALILFASLGNTWSLRDCAIVMAVGNGLCIPAVMLLCFLSDDNTSAADATSDSETDPMLSSYEYTMLTNHEEREEEPAGRSWCRLPEHRITPILICTADVMSALDWACQFATFLSSFWIILKLSPVLVQVLYILSPMGQALSDALWPRMVLVNWPMRNYCPL
jgi:hypothetical protein